MCSIAASRQVRGTQILRHLAYTCVPCASSLPNETKQWAPENQKGPPCCLWQFFCLCASPHAFHHSLPSSLLVPLNMRYLPSKDDARKILAGVTPCVFVTFFILCVERQQSFLFWFTGPFYNMTPEERIDADNRSVYVGNVRLVFGFCFVFFSIVSFFSHFWYYYCWKSQVDYGATADELEIHFNGCGPVNRVTILCDRFSGHPKGWVQLVHTDYFIWHRFDLGAQQ